MAVLAGIGGVDVITRLGGCRDKTGTRVTATAFSRSSFKNTVDVATLTSQGLVLTLHCKAGCHMVKTGCLSVGEIRSEEQYSDYAQAKAGFR